MHLSVFNQLVPSNVFGILRDEWKREITIDNTKFEIVIMIFVLRNYLFEIPNLIK